MSRFVHSLTAGLVLVVAAQNSCAVSRAAPSGKTDFRLSCSACHGEDGRGTGAKAPGLSTEPPDLTTFRRRSNGIFPRERLHRIIDGREDVKAHGDREMPVWGQLFKLDAEEGLGGAKGDEATIARRINALIDFIESFQR
jgi:hypothetical protein